MALNDGPTLDWHSIKFHEPVKPDDWWRMLPEYRFIEAMRVQWSGNVPQDLPENSSRTRRAPRRRSS